MSNEADLADIEIEQHFQAALAQRNQSMKPILRCIKCGARNDRAHLDYAVCTDCMVVTK